MGYTDRFCNRPSNGWFGKHNPITTTRNERLEWRKRGESEKAPKYSFAHEKMAGLLGSLWFLMNVDVIVAKDAFDWLVARYGSESVMSQENQTDESRVTPTPKSSTHTNKTSLYEALACYRAEKSLQWVDTWKKHVSLVFFYRKEITKHLRR